MRTVLILTMLWSVGYAQKNGYKQYTICTDSAIHKGKKNHGQYYCTGWTIIREFKNLKKDTVIVFGTGGSYADNEYEEYQKLSERGKYIVDSLKDDGIPMMHQSYLLYTPIYMKAGRKKESFWDIRNEDVVMYEYLFWKNKSGHGVELIKETKIK